MPRLLLPRRFSSQPSQPVPVDWQNPLAQGLAVATFATDDLAFFDMVSWARAAELIPGQPSFRFTSYTRWGRGRTTNGGTFRNTFAIKPVVRAGARQTALLLIRPRVLPTTDKTILSAGETSGWNPTLIRYTTGGYINGGCTNGPNLLSDAPLALGEHYAIATVCDAATESTATASQYFFINGVKQQAQSAYTGIRGHFLDQAVLGNIGESQIIDFFGMFLWNRVLSDDEIRQVSEDPYQLFGASRFVPYTAATAVPIDSAISGSGNSQAGAAGALTTAIPVTGAAAVVAAATGTVSTSISFTGRGNVIAAGSGALSTTIRLDGAAAVQASSSASLAGIEVTLTGAAAAEASASSMLSSAISLTGVAAAAAQSTGSAILADADPPGGEVIDVSRIDRGRVVVFEGSGTRVVVFEGSGSRVVIFDGGGNRVRFDQMSAKVPVKVGEKWTTDRDPDEISYYAADITQELLDRNTTADLSGVIALLFGVELLEGPDVQIATIDDIERTFVVVKLGGVADPLPDDWRWVARVGCANGERFDKTTWFNKVDP